MTNDYLYSSPSNSQYESASIAIVILPDIFGLTEYAKATCEEFSKQFQLPVYMYEYFYSLNSQANVFAPEAMDKAVEMMEQMRGEDFVQPFADVLHTIQTSNNSITEFVVIGFCFGGRLAYLSGLDGRVKRIVSFYGAGAHQPEFYATHTPIEVLCDARNNDSTLEVLSFYGNQDASIPLADREKTSEALATAHIHYQAHEVDAGHAYFQQGRPNYNQAAALQSQIVLAEFLK